MRELKYAVRFQFYNERSLSYTRSLPSASNDARFPADVFELPFLAAPAVSRILLKVRV